VVEKVVVEKVVVTAGEATVEVEREEARGAVAR